MVARSQGFQVSAPDVTCSLAFTANVKVVALQPVRPDGPSGAEMAKLEGPATMEGDALTVSYVQRHQLARERTCGGLDGGEKSCAETRHPADGSERKSDFQHVRPEKKPDVAMIYRMRAAALHGNERFTARP